MIRGSYYDSLEVHGAPNLPGHFYGTVDECRGPERKSPLAAIAAFVAAPAPVLEIASPLPPQLVPDFYWREGNPGWSLLTRATVGDPLKGTACEYAGAMLKATQGSSYFKAAIDWFVKGYKSLAGKPRADGRAEFAVLSYHYCELYRSTENAIKQADFYMDARKRAGLPVSDPWVLDVEGGGDTAANRRASRQQVIDVVSTMAGRLKTLTGAPGILYGGSLLSKLKIKDRMGLSWLWPAAYSATMSSHEYKSIGWTLDRVFAWQYTDGDVSKAVTRRGVRLPRVIPGVGSYDCSVLLPKLASADQACSLLRTARL